MGSFVSIRKLDTVGRVVIPKDARKLLEIDHGHALEFFADNDMIVLKKFESSMINCFSCDSFENLKRVGDRYICQECIDSIK